MRRLIRKHNQKGSAMVEAALLAPWIFFLFVGVLDFGFFSYAAICTQNAARVAALASAANSGANQTGACNLVVQEMNSLPNTRSASDCSALPLIVTATNITGPDGAKAVQVSVTYQSLTMIPIPGVMMGQYTITRTTVVPVFGTPAS